MDKIIGIILQEKDSNGQNLEMQESKKISEVKQILQEPSAIGVGLMEGLETFKNQEDLTAFPKLISDKDKKDLSKKQKSKESKSQKGVKTPKSKQQVKSKKRVATCEADKLLMDTQEESCSQIQVGFTTS